MKRMALELWISAVGLCRRSVAPSVGDTGGTVVGRHNTRLVVPITAGAPIRIKLAEQVRLLVAVLEQTSQ